MTPLDPERSSAGYFNLLPKNRTLPKKKYDNFLPAFPMLFLISKKFFSRFDPSELPGGLLGTYFGFHFSLLWAI